jgi:hypothetical protein
MKRALFFVLLGFVLLGLGACDEGSAVKEPAPSPSGTAATDAGGPGTGGDGGADGGPSDCFVNPKTHFEIINACTGATKIAKNPVLPKLLPDGGLPPLD